MTTPPSGNYGPLSDLAAHFMAANRPEAERQRFGTAAPAALQRLIKAVLFRDSPQALTVTRCLASIYNGSEAQPVRLDEIRWLDWSQQCDLMTVMVGTGHAGFSDFHIREAFLAAGGAEAVEWFHWYVTGGAQRAALARLAEFVQKNPDSSSARAILQALKPDHPGPGHSLDAVTNEQALDVVLVLEGRFGRDRGIVTPQEIDSAFPSA